MIFKNNRLSWVLAGILALLVCIPARSAEDRIIAIVNDELITLSDLKNYITASYMAFAHKVGAKQLEKLKSDLEINGLNRLVDDRLILSKANERGIKINSRAVDERINAAKAQYPSEQAFIDALAQSGTTLSDLKNKVSDQIKVKTFIDAYVPARVKVNPNEVIRYYKEHLNDYWQKDRVDLNSIFVGFGSDKVLAKDRFDKAVKDVQAGQDFMETARKYSDSPPIGVVKKGDLVAQIENVVFKLDEGKVSPMIETDSGYYLFQVKKKIPMSVISFQDVKDRIRDQLYQQKMKSEYDKLLDELKKDAYVEIKK